MDYLILSRFVLKGVNFILEDEFYYWYIKWILIINCKLLVRKYIIDFLIKVYEYLIICFIFLIVVDKICFFF